MGIPVVLVKVGTFAAGSIFQYFVGSGFSWLGGKVWPLFMGSKVMMKAPGIPGEHILRKAFEKNGLIFRFFVGCGFSWLGGKVWPLFMGSNAMMKAPGKPGEYILRKSFEKNPAAYFRALRGA